MKNKLIVLLLFYSFSFQAQNTPVLDSSAIYSMTLEELMNIKSSGISSELESLINSLLEVASKKPLASRKSPAIVTLITQQEIEQSGARDLIDVLRLVPGFDFGLDVQGMVGIGTRGNWAHEGKILLLIDGQEINEILYATLQFGNHFDVNQIKRIEIIRGPGSAIYGGYAEYGVISIITKNGEDINGISATATYGRMNHGADRKNISLNFGKKFKKMDVSLAGFYGESQRSDRTYTDASLKSYSMLGNSALHPFNINFGATLNKLSLRAIHDRYATTNRDNYGLNLSKAYPGNFTSSFFELKYLWEINKKLIITPRINYKSQRPWNYAGPTQAIDSAYTIYDKLAQRYTGNLTFSYDATKKINFTGGGEFFKDYASMGKDTILFSNGQRKVEYDNYAFFLQGLVKNRIANLTAGARFDNNSSFGFAFVPRIGITKKTGKFHSKLLYSQSFRSPSIENIDRSLYGKIRPESSQVIELELGYQLTTDILLTANVFDITTNNPIVYFVDTTIINGTPEGYKNANQLGSQGVEIVCKTKYDWGYIDFSYSFYTIGNKKTEPDYQSKNPSMTLAFPAHKFALSSSWNITKSFTINTTATWMGQRYGYKPTGNNLLTMETFPPVLLANVFIHYTGLFSKQLKLGIGCYNLLNDDYDFIQPYNGGHAPLPGPSREFIVKLTYSIQTKK